MDSPALANLDKLCIEQHVTDVCLSEVEEWKGERLAARSSHIFTQ